jgi:ankyrin repeat protein
MKVIVFLTRLFHSRILCLPIVVLIAMLYVTPVFCGEIHDAAKAGNLAKVKALLKNNPELVSSSDKNGRTALHWAANEGHKAVAEMLLANEADVNAKDDHSQTPLHHAAANGHRDVAELLLANKADVNAKRHAGETPLHFAAASGNKAMAELLLANKAEVNAKDNYSQTPLHLAAESGHRAMAQLLLANKAEVNAKDNYSQTPLQNAVCNAHKALAELLLAKGADVNTRNNNDHETPLHKATRDGNMSMMELLLAKGADVNAKSNLGRTPLHVALKRSKCVIELLLANKAEVNAKDNLGNTPSHIAAIIGHKDIVELLRQHGGHEYSNPDSKNTGSSIEFDRQRLVELFDSSGRTNPGDTVFLENTNLDSTDKMSVTVKPPMPQTMHTGAMGGVAGAIPGSGSTARSKSGIQSLQERIDQAKKRLDRDMALLLPGEDSAVAGAKLLILLTKFAIQNGMNIAMGTNLPEKKMQGLTKVSARIESNCDIEQLVRFMAAIENYSKHLKIEEVMISSIPQKKHEIRPFLTIAGYIHSIEGEIPAASASSIQAEALEARIASIEDILCQKDGDLEILNELTQVLPRDTYLNTYINRNGTIQLVGQSGSPEDLIWKLDRSPFFNDVVFKATGGHNGYFNIEAKLEK